MSAGCSCRNSRSAAAAPAALRSTARRKSGSVIRSWCGMPSMRNRSRLSLFQQNTTAARARLQPLRIALARHETIAGRRLDLVLHDVAGSVTLLDDALAAGRLHALPFAELEGSCRVRIIQRLRAVHPVDHEGADAMHLHDRAVGTVAEHRAPLRREGVVGGTKLLQG